MLVYPVYIIECMSERSRSGALLTLLVAVTLLSTGIVGAALANNPSTPDTQQTTDSPTEVDGEAVIENFTERLETLDTVEFTRTTESESDGKTTNTTERVVADVEDGQMRIEIRDSTYGSNSTTVVNETHIVTYNPETNTISSYEDESQETRVLPQLTQMANESAVDYEYVGTDTVEDEKVHLLDAALQQQQTRENTTMSVTVAVDTETYFPIQYETSVRSDKYNFTYTQTYSNVTINGDVPESSFTLDVPEDATEPSSNGPEITSYSDHSTLQSASELSAPAAGLPGDFKFDGARIINGDNYYSMSLMYTNGEDRVQVNVQDKSSFDWSEQDNYEAVQLGDEPGHYAEYDEYAFLRTNTDEQSYSVHGELSKDKIIEIGEAIANS